MSIQLRDIEYFAVVAEHGQLQRAAAALSLSQPALSKSVQRLEQAVGTKVLLRTPKGVELTQAGEALLGKARGLRLAFDAISREVADLGNGLVGHLRHRTRFLGAPRTRGLRRMAAGRPARVFAGDRGDCGRIAPRTFPRRTGPHRDRDTGAPV